MSSLNAAVADWPGTKLRFRASQAAPYVALALFTGAYLHLFLRSFAWNPDEGIYLYGAAITAKGALPGRDFVELQGPGTFYWLALFFRVFGVSLATARGLLMLTGVSTALLVFYLSRRAGGAGLFAALFVTVTVIPLGVMNSPHYDSNLFGLVAFALFLGAEGRLKSGVTNASVAPGFFVAGALAGLTTCFLQQKGFYLALAFATSCLVLYGRRGMRQVGYMAAGYGSVVMAVLFFYSSQHALPDLVYANFTWPVSTYESVNRAPYGFAFGESLWRSWMAVFKGNFPVPVAYFVSSLLSVPYLLILAVPVLLPAIGLSNRRTAFQRQLIPYWIAGYALWASELHRWDLGHLRNACLILTMLFFIVCDLTGQRILRPLALAVTGCLVLTAMANAVGAAARKTPVESRRGMVYALDRDSALRFLLDHTAPGDAVFVYPYQPLYYFLADLRNPTRFSNLMYGINTTQQFAECVGNLETEKVRYVLWDSVFSGQNLSTLFPAYHHPPEKQLVMELYIASHYHQIGSENGFKILERNR